MSDGSMDESSERDESTTDEPDARSTADLLAVSALDAGYGDLQILSEVDLDVHDGEYVTIVGPNGAGKSTVMKTVFGLTTYMGGAIRFADDEISGLAPEEIIHRGLSYVPQNENVFAGLSVRENLEMGAYILDSVPQDRLDWVFERFPILEERQTQRAGTLSGGQRQMLAMGRALMLDPDSPDARRTLGGARARSGRRDVRPYRRDQRVGHGDTDGRAERRRGALAV